MLRECRAVLETLSALFFPRHCAGCHGSVSAGWFCPQCLADIQPVPEPRCEVCSFPLSGAALDRFICANCQGREFHFDCAVAVLRSRGVLRDMIHRLKYGGEVWLIEPLGGYLAQGLSDKRLSDSHFDAIVPVPLHSLRRREREFNQSELLARDLSRRANLPFRDALLRQRNTVTQTHFDRLRRMQNLRDAFAMRQNVSVDGQTLLLVDDVFTTGSTLDECASTLLSAGAHSVCALTLARG